MTVVPLPGVVQTPLEPDAPRGATPDSPSAAGTGAETFSAALERALAGTETSLERADVAERAFASGRGGLQEMIVERAQADVALSIAGAAASRVAQSLTTILGMQV